jgi:hypothetical protein
MRDHAPLDPECPEVEAGSRRPFAGSVGMGAGR